MYILELYQNDYSKDLVAFDSLEEAKEFVSKIDAYVINNEEVKAYIEGRETKYDKIKDFLETNGYDVEISFFGSEDGEAILYRKKETTDWHFLCHLDPSFLDIEDLDGYVKNIRLY